MDNYFIHYVDIMCKTLSKSLRLFMVKLCAKVYSFYSTCGYIAFSTSFSYLSHILSHTNPLSIPPQSFPLIHRAYYYNYY